jgi:predicted GNAT superfamily acetyltransferase
MTGSAALPRVASRDASSEIVARASEAAARAAAAARVRVAVACEVAQLQMVSRLFAQVWLTPPGGPPLPADVMRAMVHADGAVHLAMNEDGLAGATAMIFSSPASASVYSLIAAARSSDRGVGFALKQAQRAWALERGATSMTWTFDPLVSRNARFNLVKLGAVAPGYEVDFYGPLNDGIDGQGDTDRLVAAWSLTSLRTIEAAQGGYDNTAGPSLPGAELDPQLAPDGGPLSARDQYGRWCRVPPDILAVRRADQPLADRWRSAVREVLQSALAEGLAATGFSRDGWYRLTPHRIDGGNR